MIDKKMEDALNDQIKFEMDSAHIYLSMAAYFHDKSLDGMAQWMKVQAKEELGHAMRIFEHINERGGRVELKAIDQPQKDWKCALDAFEAAYSHERFVTGKINDLVKLAADLSDNAASVFLQWFVTEQVEEEDSTSKVVETLKLIGDSSAGLVVFDAQLGSREG